MKRIILGLLFDGVDFYLSRNFRLQRLGDLAWLRANFKIFDLASQVDEVAVFHVARKLDARTFSSAINELSQNLFVPVSVGGGIRTLDDADLLFRSGADRVIFSSSLWGNKRLPREVAAKYGQQAIVGVLNYKSDNGDGVFVRALTANAPEWLPLKELDSETVSSAVGELVLQSVGRDGTGQGFPLDDLRSFEEYEATPWVAAGGFGAANHIPEALLDQRIQAALTSNLLAFAGSGLSLAREKAAEMGVQLPEWLSWTGTSGGLVR